MKDDIFRESLVSIATYETVSVNPASISFCETIPFRRKEDGVISYPCA